VQYAALNYVLMNVAHTEARKGNSFYGMAVAFIVLAGAVAGGPISGGAVCAASTGSVRSLVYKHVCF
jgi:hypothetical protein